MQRIIMKNTRTSQLKGHIAGLNSAIHHISQCAFCSVLCCLEIIIARNRVNNHFFPITAQILLNAKCSRKLSVMFSFVFFSSIWSRLWFWSFIKLKKSKDHREPEEELCNFYMINMKSSLVAGCVYVSVSVSRDHLIMSVGCWKPAMLAPVACW